MDEYIECKVSNWPKFMVFSQHLNTQKWLFRGQADSDWTLKTSHERLLDQLVDKYKFIISKVCEENRELIKLQRFSLESKIDKIKSQTLDINKIKNLKNEVETILHKSEKLAIENFKKDAQLYMNHEKQIDLLAAMQHYGTPTRLLDVTASLFIALFFAFESDIYDSKGELKPKVIWAFRRESLLSEQAGLHTASEDNSIYDLLDDELKQKQECIELACKILSGKFDYEGCIVHVTPNYYNERISAQNGSFLLSSKLGETFEDSLRHTLGISEKSYKIPKIIYIDDFLKMKSFLQTRLVKFVFDPVKCHSADNVLKNTNVSSLNLFPDIEGLARDIKY